MNRRDGLPKRPSPATEAARQHAETALRTHVETLGGTAAWTAWQGSNAKHKVICPAGHECWPRLKSLRAGNGLCLTCAGQDSRIAEAVFRANIEGQGGTVTEPTWLGAGTPHRVMCPAGHECRPRPAAVSPTRLPCPKCVHQCQSTAEASTRARVAALGGSPAWETWQGANSPHKVICRSGHECWPRPSDVQRGQGLCPKCAGKTWDRLYVVTSPRAAVVKVGITSGDPRPRLCHHRRNGFVEVIRLRDTAGADCIERAAISACRSGGYAPLKGREYFDLSALQTILDVVDNWP